jgi:predicted alpha/beta superfamily hydrolase
MDDERPVYITANFNQWSLKDEQFKMTKVDGSHFEYTFDNKDILPNHIEYKYTRGSWREDELDSFGSKTSNRIITNKNIQEVVDFVPRWSRDGKSFDEKFLPVIETVNDNFEIPQLGKTRKVRILLPHNYHKTEERFPVLYLQDGQNLFDKDAPFGTWAIDEKLAVLSEYNKGKLIIVAIDHGEKERINEYSPRENIQLGIGNDEGTKYLQFMCDTLKPHIDQHYRTLTAPEHTGVGGSSMGGLISLYAGIQHADVFGQLMIFSPSLWIYPKVYDDVAENSALAGTKIYLFAGGRESKNMLTNIHRLQHQIHKNKNKILLNLVIDPNGTHSEGRWSTEFPEAVEWLFF